MHRLTLECTISHNTVFKSQPGSTSSACHMALPPSLVAKPCPTRSPRPALASSYSSRPVMVLRGSVRLDSLGQLSTSDLRTIGPYTDHIHSNPVAKIEM